MLIIDFPIYQSQPATSIFTLNVLAYSSMDGVIILNFYIIISALLQYINIIFLVKHIKGIYVVNIFSMGFIDYNGSVQ